MEATEGATGDLLDTLALALYRDGAYCGACSYEGWGTCEDCRRCLRGYAATVLTALRCPPRGAATV